MDGDGDTRADAVIKHEVSRSLADGVRAKTGQGVEQQGCLSLTLSRESRRYAKRSLITATLPCYIHGACFANTSSVLKGLGYHCQTEWTIRRAHLPKSKSARIQVSPNCVFRHWLPLRVHAGCPKKQKSLIVPPLVCLNARPLVHRIVAVVSRRRERSCSGRL